MVPQTRYLRKVRTNIQKHLEFLNYFDEIKQKIESHDYKNAWLLSELTEKRVYTFDRKSPEYLKQDKIRFEELLQSKKYKPVLIERDRILANLAVEAKSST